LSGSARGSCIYQLDKGGILAKELNIAMPDVIASGQRLGNGKDLSHVTARLALVYVL